MSEKLKKRGNGPTCECLKYPFPHRLMSGLCSGVGFIEEIYENRHNLSLNCKRCNLNSGLECQITAGIESVKECPELERYKDSYGTSTSPFGRVRALLQKEEDKQNREKELYEFIRIFYTCRCNAYPFPHRFGGGRCNALLAVQAIYDGRLDSECQICPYNYEGECEVLSDGLHYTACNALYKYLRRPSPYHYVREALSKRMERHIDPMSLIAYELYEILYELDKITNSVDNLEEVPF